MKFTQNVAILFCLLAITTLAACTTTPTPTPSPSPIALPATETTPPPTLTPVTSPAPEVSSTATPASAPSQITAAFISAENNLYTWSDGDSSFTKITNSGDAQMAVVSPDGQLVAYSRTTDGAKYTLDVVNSDGTNQHTLFTQDDFLGIERPSSTTGTMPSQFAWMPGSHMLAMTVNYLLVGPGFGLSPDLILFNVVDGTHRVLLTEDDIYRFFYSPDGSKIAIAMPDGIDLFTSDGNRLFSPKFYRFDSVNTASEAPYVPEIIWSADSKSFAFTIPPAEPFTDAEGLTKVVKVDPATGEATTLLSLPMAFLWPQEISPDLDQIAYLTPSSGNSTEFDLHIASLNGGPDEVVAAKTAASDFSWSPDSVHFAYSVASGMTLQVYLGAIHQAPVQITQVSDARGFAWVDTSQYLALDKTASGWKVWLGGNTSAPVIVYMDDLTAGTYLPLSVNR